MIAQGLTSGIPLFTVYPHPLVIGLVLVPIGSPPSPK